MKKLHIIILEGFLMLGLLGCGNVPNINNQSLISYSSHCGGDMRGSYSSTNISTVNGDTCLTNTSSEWYAQDETVQEYLIDTAVLSEIESVFRQNHMNQWHQKKFTDLFVADGASYRYRFLFDGNTSVSFSSQIYPQRYQSVLTQIQEIISKYAAAAEKLPGLAAPVKTQEEILYKQHPDNRNIELEVYKYAQGKIYYRILNGTESDISISGEITLTGLNDAEILYTNHSTNDVAISRNSSEEQAIWPDSRLAEGIYTLTVDDYSCQFEIR